MEKKSKKGFTLVEMVIALAVTAILVAAVFSFAGSALSMSSRMKANATVEEVHNVFQNVLTGELQNASNIEIYKEQSSEALFNALRSARTVDDSMRALIFAYKEPSISSNGIKYQPGVYVYSLSLENAVGTTVDNSVVKKLNVLTDVSDVPSDANQGGAKLLFAPDFYAMQGWHFNFTPYKFHNDLGKEVYFASSHIASYDTVTGTGSANSLFSRIGHSALDGTGPVTGTLLSTDETSVVFECYNVVKAKQGDTKKAKNPPRVVGRFNYKYIDTWYDTDEDSVTYSAAAGDGSLPNTISSPPSRPKDTHNMPNYRASAVSPGAITYVLTKITKGELGHNPVVGLGDRASASNTGFDVLRALPLPDDTAKAAGNTIPLMIIYNTAFS